jgi:hypothetical protein
MGSRIGTKLTLAAVCAFALAAVPALAAVSGPAKIKPGTTASFHVSGLPKGKQLKIKLAASGGGGVIFRQKPTSDQSGNATVRFKVPFKYNVQINCNSVYAECQTKAWKNHQKATLKVCPLGGGACQTKGLRIRK